MTPDKHGRTWSDEQQAWCVPGRDGEWMPFEILGDVPPAYAKVVRSPFALDWPIRPGKLE